MKRNEGEKVNDTWMQVHDYEVFKESAQARRQSRMMWSLVEWGSCHF